MQVYIIPYSTIKLFYRLKIHSDRSQSTWGGQTEKAMDCSVDFSITSQFQLGLAFGDILQGHLVVSYVRVF